MNDIRSFASLSGSLLARKGGAKPAMRPRPIGSGTMLDDLGWDDMGYEAEQPAEHMTSSIAGLTPAPKPVVARDEQPPVHVQQRAIIQRFGRPAAEPAPEPVAAPQVAEPAPERVAEPVQEAPAPAPVAPADPVKPPLAKTAEVVEMPKRSAASQGRKAAFTLRLDHGRHLRLRLATAITGQSAQQLVTGALDRFLETLPEVDSMAGQVPVRSTKRG